MFQFMSCLQREMWATFTLMLISEVHPHLSKLAGQSIT